jgi:hypothetical protein
MKKTTVLLLLLSAAGSAGAALGPNLLTNGNFQSGAAGWSRWWGGNSGLPVTDPVEGDLCAGIWWNDDGIYQNLGTLSAGTYQLGGKLLTTGGGLVNQRVVIEANADGSIQQLDITPGVTSNVWHSVKGLLTLPASASVTFTLMLSVTGSPPSGIGYFDDLYFCRVTSPPARNYYGAKLESPSQVMHTAGQNVSDFNAYWTLMDAGEKPACYMAYCNLVTPFMPALRADLERYRNDYGIYLPVQMGLYIVGSESEIAAGLWDADIERFCKDLNQLGYPLYIRIGYECNGAHNGYDPTAYKAAFIRITNALRAHNVEAATVFNVIQGPYSAWYPGDAYVDWMSINLFSVWNIQHPYTYTFLNEAHTRGKPVLIGEADPTYWHTNQGQASWNGDFVPYFGLIENWPGIKNFCYINTDWTYSELPDWGDCRLQPYPIVYQHYKDQMNNPLYLHGKDEMALRADITGITDILPPGPVTGIDADTVTSPVLLTWSPAADETGINRYEILRDGGFAGYSTAESYQDSTVAAGKTYLYQITAIDKGGNRGPASDPILAVTAPSIERVINGEYDQGRGPWAAGYNASGLTMTTTLDTTSKLSGTNSCKLVISQVTGTDWHLQYYQNLNTQAGFGYQLSFRAVADRNTSLMVALQENHSPYNSFIARTINLTTTPQTFTFSGTSPDSDNVNLTFMLGGSAPRTIWLDAIHLTETNPNPDPQTCTAVQSRGLGLPADLSGNCRVDIEDLALLANYWLNASCGPGNEYCQGADISANGAVNLADWAVFAAQWLECNDPQETTCLPTW